MAPTAPKKRTSMRSKTTKAPPKSGSGLISRPLPTPSSSSDGFTSSKKDKRPIKHSSFLNRIEKAHKKPLKRRRPNKKLVTNLEGLADALPDIDAAGGIGRGGEGKVKMTSLSDGKGLMKRRGKVEKVERERFGKNLAMLMAAQAANTASAPTVVPNGNASSSSGDKMLVEGEGGVKKAQVVAPPSATAKRFAALRAWIGDTMEKEKAFDEQK